MLLVSLAKRELENQSNQIIDAESLRISGERSERSNRNKHRELMTRSVQADWAPLTTDLCALFER